MKKTILLLTLLLFQLSIYGQQNVIPISGTVEDPTIETLSITRFDYEPLASASLDSAGNFSMEVSIENDGYYMLNYGRETTYVYLHPNDQLTVTFNGQNFNETLQFSGSGALRNNYLIQKKRKDEKLTEDLNAFYDVSESDFLKNIQNLKDGHIKTVSSLDAEDFFIDAELKSLEYQRLLSIKSFKRSCEYYLGKEVTPSEGFYSPITKVDMTLAEDYTLNPYYYYLLNNIWDERVEAASDAMGILEILRTIPFQKLVVNQLQGLFSKISTDKENAKNYLDVIKMVIDHPPLIEEAEKLYKEATETRTIAIGEKSPQFSYKAIDGTTVSLSDLKGKYVYIDVWATWCPPCLKQVPYLKALEKQFHDRNIAFVSISVDKEEARSKWQKMIDKKELSGIQLFADQSFDSDFMKAYGVNSIPRFILIDPEGNVVDPKAPSPSQSKTTELLQTLLK